jgi:hypothetical protein
MKIKCISLPGAIERRRHMTELLDKIGLEYEFVNAYDGSQIQVVNKKIYYNDVFTGWYHDSSVVLIDQIEQFARLHYRKYWNIPYANDISVDVEGNVAWIKKNDIRQFSIDSSYFRRHMNMNEIGCALSHFEVMKGITEPTLVLEDDVYLVGNLEHTLECTKWYDLLWDIVFLNIPGYGGNPGYIEPGTLTVFSDEFDVHVYSHFSSTCSYIVKENVFANVNTINLPLDDYFSRRIDLVMLRVKEPVFMVDYTGVSGESTIDLKRES